MVLPPSTLPPGSAPQALVWCIGTANKQLFCHPANSDSKPPKLDVALKEKLLAPIKIRFESLIVYRFLVCLQEVRFVNCVVDLHFNAPT